MPHLSILIPSLGSVDLLENSLVSVLENRPSKTEIVVVHNHPYDDPYKLADEVRFVPARPGAGWSETVNLGLASCQGPVIHLLESGATVCDGWTIAPLDHFHEARVAAVAPVVLAAGHPQRLLSAGVQYTLGGNRRVLAGKLSSLVSGPVLGPTCQAAFYRRSALWRVALADGPIADRGVQPRIQVFDAAVGRRLADVDLALQLAVAGYSAVLEPASHVCAPAIPVVQHGFRAARQAERLFWRHASQRGLAPSILAHSLVVLGEALGSLPRPRVLTQLVGRALASCEWGHYRRRRLHLEALAAQKPSAQTRVGPPRPHMATHPGVHQSERQGTHVTR